MAVESILIPLQTKLPSFTLPDPEGKSHDSANLGGSKGLLLIVTCNHCPYAIAVWPRLIALANWAKPEGINSVALNPNIHPSYPDDAPERMKEKIVEWKIEFPYLIDESQDIAKELEAQCTPDLYLYNQNSELVYHGRIDNNWQDESKVTSQELRAAMQSLIAGEAISEKQYPSMGCSIKWK